MARADLSGLLRNGFYVVGGGGRVVVGSAAFVAVWLWLAGGMAVWCGDGDGGGGGACGDVGGRHVRVWQRAGVRLVTQSAVW